MEPCPGSRTAPTIVPKVDWLMVHGADNKIAIKSTAIFPSFITRPPVARKERASCVNGKYKTAPKKVVSKIFKEQLGQMRLLNRWGKSLLAVAPR